MFKTLYIDFLQPVVPACTFRCTVAPSEAELKLLNDLISKWRIDGVAGVAKVARWTRHRGADVGTSSMYSSYEHVFFSVG